MESMRPQKNEEPHTYDKTKRKVVTAPSLASFYGRILFLKRLVPVLIIWFFYQGNVRIVRIISLHKRFLWENAHLNSCNSAQQQHCKQNISSTGKVYCDGNLEHDTSFISVKGVKTSWVSPTLEHKSLQISGFKKFYFQDCVFIFCVCL